MSQVSVVIPTHNRAFIIGDAIRSVLEQTFQDFEIIIVDDASTDSTEEVVRSFQDERISYVKLDGKIGASAARNVGIRTAKSEYVAFLDSDDLWLPDKLEKQLEVFKDGNTKLGVVYTRWIWVPRYLGVEPGKTFRGDVHRYFLTNVPTGPCTITLLCKKNYLALVGGFDERFPAMQEYELHLRLSRHCSYDFVADIEAVARTMGDVISSDDIAQLVARKLLLEKHEDLFRCDRKGFGSLLLGIGRQYCRLGNVFMGARYLLNSIRAFPAQRKAYYHLLSAMLGPEFYRLAWRSTDFLRNMKRLLLNAMRKQPQIPENVLTFLSRYESNKCYPWLRGVGR